MNNQTQRQPPSQPPPRRYDVDRVRQQVHMLLVHQGCRDDVAAAVSDVLIEAELTGVRTHGLRLLPIYLERLRRRVMNPSPTMRPLHETPTTVLLDGDAGPGPFVATHALDRCLELGAGSGLAAAGACNSNHFGPAGYYARRGARHGFVTVATTNGSPAMAPWGAKRPFFAATPIAIGVPRRAGAPLLLDIALTTSARARIRIHASRGEPIPADWALDREGQPTTDANAALQGALLPIGRHKGYGLAFMLEVLTAALTGAALGPDVRDLYEGLDGPQGLGHFFLVLSPERFQTTGAFYDTLDDLVGRLKALPPAPGFPRVMVPGEDQAQLREEQLHRGLVLEEFTVEAIGRLLGEAGLERL